MLTIKQIWICELQGIGSQSLGRGRPAGRAAQAAPGSGGCGGKNLRQQSGRSRKRPPLGCPGPAGVCEHRPAQRGHRGPAVAKEVPSLKDGGRPRLDLDRHLPGPVVRSPLSLTALGGGAVRFPCRLGVGVGVGVGAEGQADRSQTSCLRSGKRH